ncbi:putative oxidoreductase [Ereboglobus sp. PH5-5]|uniref:DoxX family protein n=1 Tax=Ereboglobus sp. PH5-5 TaxID=2940529 RepID=UPI002407433E|nr:DoxX family protein [Ereboglobus sp. PH5-5]MDF9832457.1 putative oxidoreductase [Ereboglobus sp. PH5-5]
MNKLIRKVFSTNSSNWAALPIRLAAGGVFLAHGAQKLFGAWGGHGLQGTAGFLEGTLHMKPGILWASLAAGGEFFGGVAILLGLATRFFGLVTTIIMATAIYTVHNSAFFLANNGMEYALVLMLASFALVISGGGAFSADSLIARKSNAG